MSSLERTGSLFLALVFSSNLPVSAAPTQAPTASGWLVLDRVDERGRRPFRPDAVFARHLLDPTATGPKAGAEILGELGSATWEPREPDENGRLGGGFAYAWTRVEAADTRVWLAHLSGASTLFVGGAGFTGNVYCYAGWGGVPVLLEAGANDVFVTGVRGSFELQWQAPPAELFGASWDATLPDLVRGERYVGEGAILVVNASTTPRRDVEIVVSGPEPIARVVTRVRADLPALGVTKLPIPLVVGPVRGGASGAVVNELELSVGVRDPATADGFATSIYRLAVRPSGAAGRRTFRSAIDDSVQQYSVLEPAPRVAGVEPGLVLSLHGASVDALNQANSYAAKPDWWLVAPTNRRPFGFDWQDWGRQDAYEVLAQALSISGVARERVVLTGHSMGGHGTWHLAANDADGFAAIGPSAGWRSFDTYGGRPDGELQALWHAADAASSTEALLSNLSALPVYVLHGDADRTVPVTEARAIESALREQGADVASHYQPEAGHWWDAEGAGVACVDWPAMVECFRSARIPHDPDRIAFTTVDPAIDADHHWVRVEQPLEYGRSSSVQAERDRATRTIRATTENVRRLGVQLEYGSEPWTLVVDSDTFEVVQGAGRAAEPAHFAHIEGAWQRTERASDSEKRPELCGPFKQLFDRGFVFVVGTGGDPVAARVRAERARYDATTWWYRGNGRVAVLTDHEFATASAEFERRNVVLYGSAATCSVWRELVSAEGPLDVSAAGVRLGERVFDGEGLAAVFVLRAQTSPDADSDRLVGAFADRDARGARTGYLLAPFVSGVGYPDYVVFDESVASAGDGGVLAAGWFDAAWQMGPAGELTFERDR